MYKVTTKNGTVFFMTIDDALVYVVKKENQLFADGSYVKISFVEEIDL